MSKESAQGLSGGGPRLLWADAGSERAQALARRLGLRLVRELSADGADEADESPVLRLDGAGLALGLAGMAPAHMLRVDFARLLPRLHPRRLGRELLVRAARFRGLGREPLALDATAGLGEDAFLLAAAGFRVEMYESNPLIAALLADGLARARAIPELTAPCGRMRLFERDSVAAMRERAAAAAGPDLILLDPMFPPRKKSAAVKKKLRLLQLIERPCADEAALLEAALALGPRRIVIKRPLKGPPLAGRAAERVLTGRAIRFDCLAGRAGSRD